MGRPKKLSKEQVLAAINDWMIERGMPPSVEELRRRLRVGSTRTVLRYLRWLEDEGDIERWPGARGLRPRKGPSGIETRLVPVVGEAPAGPLMLAEENIEGWVQLPKNFVAPGTKFFLLRVRGDSMNRARVAGELIEDGDLVLVRRQPTADPGQIVVAFIDGQATIKRLAKAPGYYVLKPDSSNSKHQPIIVGDDFQVQGIVVRLFKKGSKLITAS